jgi:hypothetical protein
LSGKRTIRANENLIKHAALYQRDALASRRHYEELMKDFEMLKRLMADYGAGYIFVDDFKPNELQVLDPTDKTCVTFKPIGMRYHFFHSGRKRLQ